METGSQPPRKDPPAGKGWQFWIDRGGTFTDVIGLSPAGALQVRKVPSVARAGAAGDPGLAAVRELMAQAPPGERIHSVKVGTTVATNALLTRSGEPVLLVTTAGFGDALRIGYQNRPDIFARHIVLPQRLYASVIEARERIDAHGKVLTPLDGARLREALARARRPGAARSPSSSCTAGATRSTSARRRACARELGFEEVSVSHELSPLVRYVARADTTVLNAYLALPLSRYLQRLRQELRRARPQGAQLDAHAEQRRPGGGGALPRHGERALGSGRRPDRDALGGRAAEAGARLIGFDMGGTSTDVSLIDGELPQRFEHLIGGVRLAQPMLDVHIDRRRRRLDPRLSRRALRRGPGLRRRRPGPGLLRARRAAHPHRRAGAARAFARRHAARALRPRRHARASIPRRSRWRSRSSPRRPRPGGAGGCAAESVAESFLEVGVESMANAIRQVSTRQGLDAADFTLFCFGGAAGQHACRVARAAGVRRILVHPLASVLSAFGIGVADRLAVRRASLRAAARCRPGSTRRAPRSPSWMQARAPSCAADDARRRSRVAHGCSSCAPATAM